MHWDHLEEDKDARGCDQCFLQDAFLTNIILLIDSSTPSLWCGGSANVYASS